MSTEHTTIHNSFSHKHITTHTGLGRVPTKGRCACLCLGCGRATHHYGSHTGVFTQGCGLTEKTFQPQQLSFFKAEIRQGPCDITPAEWILHTEAGILNVISVFITPKEKNIVLVHVCLVRQPKQIKKVETVHFNGKTKVTFHFLTQPTTTCCPPPPSPTICVRVTNQLTAI